LHIPIQSGDEQILEAMNRPYRSGDLWRLFEALDQRLPHQVALGSDFITGFPGETDAQFENTLKLVQQSPLTHLHVFPFSPRPATVAAAMTKGRVERSVARERAQRLRQAGQEKLGQFAAQQRGKMGQVIVEKSLAKGHLLGITGNYLRVVFQGDPSLLGSLVAVKIQGLVKAQGESLLLAGERL
jgi:threonylcarbamoyladenosine tRNA methylthiotransferase MtaB